MEGEGRGNEGQAREGEWVCRTEVLFVGMTECRCTGD